MAQQTKRSGSCSGAANEALRKLLAKTLGVSKSDVEIVRGDRARIKLLRVDGIRAAEVRFDLG